jgi:hypothetical protein
MSVHALGVAKHLVDIDEDALGVARAEFGYADDSRHLSDLGDPFVKDELGSRRAGNLVRWNTGTIR